uniref:Uncharacterized protein n=1 Tax=Pararge aegeria TaxID=116150 RepID=S4P2W1_9NEOP
MRQSTAYANISIFLTAYRRRFYILCSPSRQKLCTSHFPGGNNRGIANSNRKMKWMIVDLTNNLSEII